MVSVAGSMPLRSLSVGVSRKGSASPSQVIPRSDALTQARSGIDTAPAFSTLPGKNTHHSTCAFPPACGVLMTDWNADPAATRTLPINDGYWAFAFEDSGVGLWDWDVTTNRVMFSNGWKDMFGYAENEVGNDLEEWTSRVHPDDRPQAMADIQRHFQGETAMFANEHRRRCKDGSLMGSGTRRLFTD